MNTILRKAMVLRRVTTDLVTISTTLRRAGKGTILGILMMGFNKASKTPRLHLTNPQNKLLYPPLHRAL
jgi:hypothetical protein